MPDLSIVIVTYNASDTLPVTLASIRAQEGLALGQIEVLVVDGASQDGSAEIARQSGVVDKVVSEPDLGIYDAMNKGTRLAQGRLIQYLNAGDWLSRSDSLRLVLAAAVESPSSLWLISGATNHSGGQGPVLRIPNSPHVWWQHALGLRPHCHQACWFDRKLFLSMGAFSLDFGTASDFDQVLRFGLLGKPKEIPEVLIGYLGGGVSDQTAWQTAQLLDVVRQARFGIGPTTGRLLMWVTALVNVFRVKFGSVRRSMMSDSRHYE